MAMLGTGDLHSTLVAWAKILLPLLALAILSTLFMVAHPTDPEDAIPYADVDVADRLREPRLTAPTFAGVTTDGADVTLKAAEAVPGQAGTSRAGQASGLSGQVATPDGITSHVTAATATLDQAGDVVSLAGGVTLTNSAGYRIATDRLDMALDRTHLESGGAVTAEAPFGSIQAGKLVLTRDAQGDYKLDFTGGVRLLYQPAQQEVSP